VESWFRRFLRLTAAAVFLFTAIELLLLEHTETWIQWIAFSLCGIGLFASLNAMRRSDRPSVRLARWSGVLIIIGTIYGIVEHVLHNAELELEFRPNAVWSDVFWISLMGAAPLLASGILIFGALLLLASTKQVDQGPSYS